MKRISLVFFVVCCPLLIAAPVDPSNVDLNADLRIDVQDFFIFAPAWLSHDGPSDDWNAVCDISTPADGIIDHNDLSALMDQWLVAIPDPNDYINPADIVPDRIIDMKDLTIFSESWLSDSNSIQWNPACDIAEPYDGVIDINDLLIVVSNWLVVVPDPNDYIVVPDFNEDGFVDYLDFSTFSDAWLSDPDPMPEWNAVCDFAEVGQGRIDAADFAVMAALWKFTIPDPNIFVYIPAGQFEMGDHHDAMTNARPIHQVQLDSFYISKYQATNSQYCTFLNDAFENGQIKVDDGKVYPIADASNIYPYFDTHQTYPYSQIDFMNGIFSVRTKDGVLMSNYPAVAVSWYGAAAYCNWRSEYEGYDPCYDTLTWQCDYSTRGYRLPTEAQWEYAACGGQYEPYYRYPWGNEIDASQANYWLSRSDPNNPVSYPVLTSVGYYDGSQMPPGQDMANGWGLYDMAGNVLEWCGDWYSGSYYSISPESNPTGPAATASKVMRGGSWNNDAKRCRVAYREDDHDPATRSGSYGFRVSFGPLPISN